MEVIFTKDLKNQGKKGQIKEVKDGYAENYLIKKGYAVKKSKENLAKLNHELRRQEQENQAQREAALELQKKLANITLEFKVKTGIGDKVFGSISIKQIKEELQKQGFKIDKSAIEIPSQIASLGFHNVNLNLYSDIKAQIKVHVIK